MVGDRRSWAAGAAVAFVAAVAGGGVAAPAAGTTARSGGGYRILLTSNRDGMTRGYSVRPDGSRLTSLLPRGRALVPAALSSDGGTIAYGDKSGIYVSRADGSRLRRVVPGPASGPALSRDGRLLAFTKAGPGIWIADTNRGASRRLTRGDDGAPAWSPDGRALAFVRTKGDFAGTLVVRSLRGRVRVLSWGEFDFPPQWSPDGRWIAYALTKDDPSFHTELWVVRPNGARRHRVGREIQAFSWAPDSRKLAFAVHYGEDVAVVGVDGRGRRLGLRGPYTVALTWSLDGRRLVLAASGQIWTVGRHGRGLRRVTSAGSNSLLGVTRLAPRLPAARPVPPTERVIGTRALAFRAPVTDISADGARVAFIAGRTATDCFHVAVWTPARRSVRRFDLPAPCAGLGNREGWPALAFAGTRAAWLHTTGGNTLEQYVLTATLARPTVVGVADAYAFGDASYGTFVDALAGDGALLAFGVERVCETYQTDEDACPPGRQSGDVTAAAVYRIGGSGPCPFDRRKPRACTPVAEAAGELRLLAVDAGRLVVATESGVRLLTADGSVLRDFAVAAGAAALSGNSLALTTAGGLDVYDTRSGTRTARFSGFSRLQDLEGDILVTASGSTVTLTRLGDGRTTTFRAIGTARAQLERPGLFVAGARRVTFTPMRDVLRRLGG